jgi:hypothetical protein
VAKATEWEKFADCDNGNLVLDRSGSGWDVRHQLVLRGEPLEHFAGEDALPSGIHQEDEFIAGLNVYDSLYFASRAISAPPIEYVRMWISPSRSRNTVKIYVQKETRLGSGGRTLASWDFYNCWFK